MAESFAEASRYDMYSVMVDEADLYIMAGNLDQGLASLNRAEQAAEQAGLLDDESLRRALLSRRARVGEAESALRQLRSLLESADEQDSDYWETAILVVRVAAALDDVPPETALAERTVEFFRSQPGDRKMENPKR